MKNRIAWFLAWTGMLLTPAYGFAVSFNCVDILFTVDNILRISAGAFLIVGIIFFSPLLRIFERLSKNKGAKGPAVLVGAFFYGVTGGLILFISGHIALLIVSAYQEASSVTPSWFVVAIPAIFICLWIAHAYGSIPAGYAYAKAWRLTYAYGCVLLGTIVYAVMFGISNLIKFFNTVFAQGIVDLSALTGFEANCPKWGPNYPLLAIFILLLCLDGMFLRWYLTRMSKQNHATQ